MPGTSGDMLDQARLLGEGGPTMRARPKPALMLLLMLIQMAFGVVQMWTLIALEPQSWLVSGHVDSETIFVPCCKVALTTSQCRILQVLTSDVGLQNLSAAAHLPANGAGFVPLLNSA